MRSGFLLACLVTLGACTSVVSLKPAVPYDAGITDSRILGSWTLVGPEDSVSLLITESKPGVYRITSPDPEAQTPSYELRIGTFGGDYDLLEVRLDLSSLPGSDSVGYYPWALETYSQYLVRRTGAELEFAAFDLDALADAIAGVALSVDHVRITEGVLGPCDSRISADSARAEFMQQPGADTSITRKGRSLVLPE
mgnify:CR=1 FL=1